MDGPDYMYMENFSGCDYNGYLKIMLGTLCLLHNEVCLEYSGLVVTRMDTPRLPSSLKIHDRSHKIRLKAEENGVLYNKHNVSNLILVTTEFQPRLKLILLGGLNFSPTFITNALKITLAIT